MMNKVKRFPYLCKQIILADNSIREALSELSAIEAVIRMDTRREENFQLKIGKPKYSFTAYNKIKRATLLSYTYDVAQ